MKSDLKQKLEFIFGRRSIRVFTPGDVKESTVKAILEAAMAAPSANAKDPWRFVVVRNRKVLTQLADALPHGKMIGTGAVGVVVCGDMEAAHDHQLSYLLQDCSAAVENLLLAAHVLGLGACWLGVHPRQDRVQSVSKILGLPASVIPIAAIAIGHCGEEKAPRSRYNASWVHQEKW